MNENNSDQFPLKGLSDDEVSASRAQHGINLLTPPSREPWWKLFFSKFDDPVIRILIIAAIIAIGVGAMDGKYVEGVGVIVAILLATSLAFLNEYRANREFDVLNQVNEEVPVKTIRNGNPVTVAKKDLVVGDIVFLEMGEEVPADASVLDAVSLQLSEARLTGESLPVPKVAEGKTVQDSAKHETAYPSDRVYRSTIIADGRGTFRITAVGDHTEIGKTARAAMEESGEKTPLTIQLERLSKIIGVIGFTAAAFLYISLIVMDTTSGQFHLTPAEWYFVGILTTGAVLALIPLWFPILYDALELLGSSAKLPAYLEREGLRKWVYSLLLGMLFFGITLSLGHNLGWISLQPRSWLPLDVAKEFLKYFMIAVTLIVVAVPEGLAMSVTLSLAYSMRKMINSNVLVRRMHACETIGAATVICTDKTGTLTLNEMKIQEVEFSWLAKNSLGRDKSGESERRLIEAICVNSTAHLSKENGSFRIIGNPTEGALLLWLQEQECHYLDYRTNFSIMQQWPFNAERKYMAIVGSSPGSKKLIFYAKGAPEILLEASQYVMTKKGLKETKNHRAAIEEKLVNFENRGMRVLGFAYREIDNDENTTEVGTLFQNLTWMGFVAIADGLRPEVPEVIATCKRAGIMVKVLTGDSPVTAREIARQIGLAGDDDKPEQYLTGPQFSQLDDDRAADVAMHINILARARPMDKLKLVECLKKKGHVVAVTGDGTNDAPALNHANVGLAMGKMGTAVAKEASDIVILDDAFKSIVNAVMWGRTLYQNIQKFIVFQLTINVAALAIVLLGPFLGVKLPLTVPQMLWVNLIMDTFAALALATNSPHKGIMNRPPRSPGSFIINKNMAINLFGTASFFLLVLCGFLIYVQRDSVVTDYELSCFFTVFVMLQFWNLFNVKCLGSSESALVNLFANKTFAIIALLILLGQFVIVQWGGAIFRTVPLHLVDWLFISGATALVLFAGECIRLGMRLKSKLQADI